MTKRWTLERARKEFSPSVVMKLRINKRQSRTEIFIECPTKHYRCSAINPRWLPVNRVMRQKKEGRIPGNCFECSSLRFWTLESVRKELSSLAVKIRTIKSLRQVLWKCPIGCYGCLAKKPRWCDIGQAVQVKKKGGKVGVCRSCCNFKGGSRSKTGYVAVRIKGRSVGEHRVIMGRMLGRRLKKGETVHHKNGKRADNRESNLELRMAGNHPRGWSLRQMREYLKTVPRRLGGLK